ncbi:lysine-specific histone demethylase 1B [Exaiptasia diaphana]|uniref:Amine oxidase domain-containing protein n=1 Tax=Exaiptasia diaphana TaxID=2652724 RepID=A0A913Y6K6_EXADI|nr:lysine-specific histone demethylase 1B [Exaiptasia diaphana]
MVEFTPKLPIEKTNAIANLGAGLIEKVALKFSRNFWSKKTGGSDFFGRVPSSISNRGSCGIFYDLSRKSTPKKSHVLMTVLTGELALQASSMNDGQIVQHVLDLLKGLFPGETIPKPDKYIVSHWGQDPYSGMAYSFVPLGSTGQDYDEIAKSLEDKLFFAGEATNRQFPQTVTGAYISGIREAEKILMRKFEEEEGFL